MIAPAVPLASRPDGRAATREIPKGAQPEKILHPDRASPKRIHSP